MLNPVLPAPRTRRIQTARRNVVDVILNARSAADLRLYEWEDRGKTPTGKTRWYDTDTKKTRYQISKPGTGRGKKAAVDATAAPAEGEKPQAKQPAQKKAGAPRKPKVDHNEVGDRIEKMLGTDFADRDVGALREELLSLTGAQIEELRKRFPFKGGRTKADKAGRLAGHVGGSRKRGEQPAPGAAPAPEEKGATGGPIQDLVENAFRVGKKTQDPDVRILTRKQVENLLASHSQAHGIATITEAERGAFSTAYTGLPVSLAPLPGGGFSVHKGLANSSHTPPAPAPEKPARKPRAVKQPVRQPEPTPAPAPQAPTPDAREQRTRSGLGQATVGRSGRLHQSLSDAGIKSSSVARQAIADLEDVVSGKKTHKDLEKESAQLKRLARTAPTASDRRRAEELLQAIAWVGDESYAPSSLRGEHHSNLVNEIREMREANSANARKRLGGEQLGLFDSPQQSAAQQPQPSAAAPPANRVPLRSDVRSAAERKRVARAAHANRLRSQGILNARNPVDVVLHARSPQQARPLLYAWLRTASKRNPSKTVWVNSTNPKDRRYQEAMPKQRATQSVESLPPQEHLQQILEAPYRVADYYLTSLQTRLRRMRPGALAALRMQFDKEG